VSAVSAARRTRAPLLAPEVVLVRPAVGGVAYVGRSVAAALRTRGHSVAELELADTGAPALRALSEAWRLRGALRRARTVHVELGSTGLGVFWFALIATLLRRDVVLILTAHADYDWAAIVQESPLVIDTRNATGSLPATSHVVRL